MRFTLVADPTLVTFNSASCSLSSAATGAVSCSWNIDNPALNPLNLWAEAFVNVDYECVNPKNGRVASTEQRQLRTLKQYFGLSDASLTGADESLPAPQLMNDYTGKMKKMNACSGNTVPQNLSWSLAYWDVSVVTTTGTLRMSCFASDNSNGCFTN
jgi:hypothetical protein